MNPDSFTPANFQVYRGSNAVAGKTVLDAEGIAGAFLPAQPLAPLAPYSVVLTAGIEGENGAVLPAPLQFYFQTGPASDETSPFVLSTEPAKDAQDVSPGAILAATFSEGIDLATMDEQSFQLRDASGMAIEGEVQAEGAHAVFSPKSPLPGDGKFFATVGPGVEDLAGNAMKAPYVWSFQTHETQKPQVVQTSPAPGSAKLSPGTKVAATFSEAMDALTLGDGSLALSDEFGNLFPGSLSYDAATLTLTLVPAKPLPLSLFKATVSASAADLFGNSLGQDFSWSFDTLTGEWSPPTALQEPGASVFQGRVAAFSGNGRAAAAWNQQKAGYSVRARIYDPIAGWGPDQAVSEGTNLQVDEFFLAMNSFTGEACLIWDQTPPREVFAARLSKDSANWEAPKLLGLGFSEGQKPRVAMASFAKTGHAIWLDKDNPMLAHSVHASQLSPAGWSFPQQAFSPIGAQDPESLGLAAEGVSGRAYLVWTEQADGDDFGNVYSSRFQPAPGVWEAPMRLTADLDHSAFPVAGADSSGAGAWVIFLQKGPADERTNAYALAVPPEGAVLGAPIRLSLDNAVCTSPAVAVEPATGAAFAAWLQGESPFPSTVKGVHAARKPIGQPWQAPQTVQAPFSPCKDLFLAAEEGTDAAHLLWVQQGEGDSMQNVYWAQYDAASNSWSAPFRLSEDAGPCSFPQLAAFVQGGVKTSIALWVQGPPQSRSLVSRILKK